jgi:putative transposase
LILSIEGWETSKLAEPVFGVTSTTMPKRLVRYQTCGAFHFLTFSCYRRQPMLGNGLACDVFERELEAVRGRNGLVVAGYVLMPEHVHLLTGDPMTASLSVALQVLKQQTSKKLKTRGEDRFRQRRCYEFNVYSESKRVEKLRYMHRNPVVRGLVEKPEDWPWSSFRHYAMGEIGTVEIESEWTAQRRESARKLAGEQLRILPPQ